MIVLMCGSYVCVFFFSSRRRHTRFDCDWSSDVCSSDLGLLDLREREPEERLQFIDAEQLRDVRLGEQAESPGRASARPHQAQLFVVSDRPRGEPRAANHFLHPMLLRGRAGGRSCDWRLRGFNHAGSITSQKNLESLKNKYHNIVQLSRQCHIWHKQRNAWKSLDIAYLSP